MLERLLSLAREDPAVVAAAVLGSHALGTADRFSDLDLGLGIDGSLDDALDRWTSLLYKEFDALHHWDLRSGSSIYRVFLLPDWLEVDLSFTPAADFGPRGPAFKLVFGQTHSVSSASVGQPHLGMAWHHLLHARVAIERGRLWQAEHWIGAARTQILAMACARLGLPTAYAKRAHELPEPVTAPLAATLVRSLEPQELRRALNALLPCFAAEARLSDPDAAARIVPAMTQFPLGADPTPPHP